MAKAKAKVELNREGWLAAAVAAMRPWFDEVGVELPENVRVSCSLLAGAGIKSKKSAIGHCQYAESTGNQMIEVRICPTQGDSTKVAGILLHELIHAALPVGTGHRGAFPRTAAGLGLVKPWTATSESDELTERIQAEVIKPLGEYPHEPINIRRRGQRGVGSRMIKVECAECDFIIRTTRIHLDRAELEVESSGNALACPFPYCEGQLWISDRAWLGCYPGLDAPWLIGPHGEPKSQGDD